MGGLLRSGGAGFLLVSAAALLVIVGLWVVARDGPSARNARAPVIAPTPTPEEERGGVGQQPFPTARLARVRVVSPLSPTAAPPGWGLPRRRPAAPTATGWQLVVGAVGTGDATGSRSLGEGAGAAPPVPRPSPTPARSVRPER